MDSSPAEPNRAAAEAGCWHVAHALAGWSAFIEHLRTGHGIDEAPEDDLDAWRVHEELHKSRGEADP